MKKKNAALFALCTTVLVSPSTSKCLNPFVATFYICTSYKLICGAVKASEHEQSKKIVEWSEKACKWWVDKTEEFGFESSKTIKIYRAVYEKDPDASLWEIYKQVRIQKSQAEKRRQKSSKEQKEKTDKNLNLKNVKETPEENPVKSKEEEKVEKPENLKKAQQVAKEGSQAHKEQTKKEEIKVVGKKED